MQENALFENEFMNYGIFYFILEWEKRQYGQQNAEVKLLKFPAENSCLPSSKLLKQHTKRVYLPN